MSATHDPDRTTDDGPPSDPLDAGLAAAFGPDPAPPPPGSALEALAASLPEVPRVHLREPATEGFTPVNLPDSPSMPEVPAGLPARLQLVGEIARGGMGAVLKGRDTDLGRDVAVKVLLESHRDKPELARRFLEEAQIAGQLQHPGIVPVYELGAFADGRPYFTMKLVKGQTLAALLAARPEVPADRPRFLGIFAQVCQTLAYAHARGVIHRDLKPSNVMVGAFGEVQVMDWGLAKALREGGAADDERASRGRQPPEEATVIRPARTQEEGTPEVEPQTRAGSVLGTPAYMAPEQARGEVDLIDERADVFGLGAILCEILTGRPPFTGKKAEAQRKAEAARLEDVYTRLDGCEADGELIALARRCLAAEPWDRPRHAGEVAEQVTAYQHTVAERLRRAELERATAEVKAGEERKRRRLTAGLAAALLALVVVAAGGGLWLQRLEADRRAAAARHDAEQRAVADRQEAERRQQVLAALDRVTAFEKEARWAEARVALEQATTRLGDAGPEDLRRRLDRARADLDLIDRLETVRLRVTVNFVKEGLYRTTADDYAGVFREAGLGREGDDPAAVAARVRASPLREHLLAALDEWAMISFGQRVEWPLAVARLADPHPWRDRFRRPEVWKDRKALEQLAGEAKVAEVTPRVVTALAWALIRNQADHVPLLTKAQRLHPTDFWINNLLGTSLYVAGKPDDAIGYYRAALAVRPQVGAIHDLLGIALHMARRPGEALGEYEKAIALDPGDAAPHYNRGKLLAEQGKWAQATAAFRKALELDPNCIQARVGLGAALAEQGQFEKAVDQLNQALAGNPRDESAHYNLATIRCHQRRLDEAIDLFKKAVALDPRHAAAYHNLGTALAQRGRWDDAIDAYRKALAIDPNIALARHSLGALLSLKGLPDEALPELTKAVALDPNAAEFHYSLGNAFRAKDRLEEAAAAYRKAIELRPDHPEAHCNLGVTLRKRGQFLAALAELKRGHELGSRQKDWRNPSARWVRECEALLALDKRLPAIVKGEAKPDSAPASLELAEFLLSSKRSLAAARLYAAAFALDPESAGDLRRPHRYNAACAAVLAALGQSQEAVWLDDKERARLRRQALEWLRADLTAWGKPANRTLARQRLQHWRQDKDLVGVRDNDALEKLPDDEREAWQKLWADVDALLQKSGEKPG